VADIGRRKAPRRPDSARAALPTLVDAVKALAHPGRLRMLAMLQGGDLCVCQMTAVLELAASTVSSHLSGLRRAGLVTERKSGKWVHYHLVDTGPLAELVRQALELVGEDDRLSQDARVVDGLRRTPLETLCRTGFDRTTVGLVPRLSPPARAGGGRARTVRSADERRAR
jgi:ArsR family transcriptional regulator, arsenate/arsenite/antimonite-responsive transcriptional repressor